MRNSLLCAIAPTATIASIAGCCECIEPQVSNLFKRETLSGDFMQVNRYLVAELQKLDEVAYIRFASVYKRFQDLNEFREEIDRLSREPAKG